MFSRELSASVGYRGPLMVIIWYMFAGTFIRLISPAIGKLLAKQQKLEGIYRSCHTKIQQNAEEIAFFRGDCWEREQLKEKFEDLIAHNKKLMRKRLYQGTMDSMLTKYGATLVGYTVLGLPVFGPGSEQYLKKIGNEASNITRDYIKNSSLLISLAKAIGRLVISYKEIQQLAGYTSLISELDEVLTDLEKGIYKKTLINKISDQDQYNGLENLSSIKMNRNRIETLKNDVYIEFEGLPIIAPNGEQFCKEISIKIEQNMNVLVTGPNASGKTSLFRILSGLWPIFKGNLKRPEQIHIEELRWETERSWKDVFSGGEKQRISMARLFYHQPKFAILDECTSAVQKDVEENLYKQAREQGTTLFTISHKVDALSQYHDYILRFDGQGGYTFEKIKK